MLRSYLNLRLGTVMGWLKQLVPKEQRGSRPRCILFTHGTCSQVADHLTGLVNLPDVQITTDDKWMPNGKPVFNNGSWNIEPVKELDLIKPNLLVSSAVRQELTNWWLKKPSGRSPSWDIASTCTIEDKHGLLLVEAKAHSNELVEGESDKSGSKGPNKEQIGKAVAEAAHALEFETDNTWNISRDHHYQLSNRFAWAWKLTTLGIPVVLAYLGFLNACDMTKRGKLFHSESDWELTLREYCEGTIDNAC